MVGHDEVSRRSDPSSSLTSKQLRAWQVSHFGPERGPAHISPFVGCSIGLLHRKVPIVGVIAQPFFNRIVSARCS